MPNLIYLDEPHLRFRHDQAMLDPRDGLSLFGPLDNAKPHGIRWGVIGPRDAIARMRKWVERIQGPIISGTNLVARPVFPGFEAAFGVPWRSVPDLVVEVPPDRLRNAVMNADRHQRVYRAVSMYADRIRDTLRSEDVTPDLWCVVIPEHVYQYCRPNSLVPTELRIQPAASMSPGRAKDIASMPSLFEEENALAQEYTYKVNFHNQLKARLLDLKVPTQIVRETTIGHRDFKDDRGNPIRPLDDLESSIAWTLSTAVFYKAGGRPWKLGAAREGVCYIGLVFKHDEREHNPQMACCAAQMFLDSGDGVVFKGAVGPWYRGKKGVFHLDRCSAREVVRMCVDAYKSKNEGKSPNQLFIHGRVNFDDSEEWAGFMEGARPNTQVVGVRIRPVYQSLKLFRMGDHPVLRGLAYVTGKRKAFLWTKGMVPRLRTYPGREVPNPVHVDICRGDADIETVLRDVMALTKLNYNACGFADGLPVTLKFANAVGEILTAGSTRKTQIPPLPFKFYI